MPRFFKINFSIPAGKLNLKQRHLNSSEQYTEIHPYQRSLYFLFAFLLLLGLTSCSKVSLPGAKPEFYSEKYYEKHPQKKFGGLLKQTQLGQDPKTLNPWTASDASSSSYASLMYEGLINIDPDTDEVIPHLAKDFKISSNQKEIEVDLRDDIFWSDGTPITADDVLFTWNTLIRDGVAQSSLKDILTVEGKFPSVTKISSKKVLFKTDEIFAPFLRNLGIEIAPKHHIEAYFKARSALSFEEQRAAFNNYLSTNTKPEDMVTSGPFIFQQIKAGERIEFVRNPNYFLKDPDTGKSYPYLDRILFSFVQDSSADIFKFLAGESDILAVTPQNASLIKGYEAKYNFTLYELGASNGTNFFWFNLSKNVPEPKYSWFNSEKFRSALSYAIDRQIMIDNVFQGLASPLYTAISLKSPYFNSQLKQEYDLERARQLLSEAGFKIKRKLKDADKIQLVDANDNEVSFDLFTNAGNRERELMGVIIADNLSKLGIKVNFKLLEFNAFVGKVMSGSGYEAGILSLTGSSEPNSGANVWNSEGRLHLFDVKATQEQPITRAWEHEIDDLYARGVRTMDFKKRKQIYDRFQKIVFEHNPLIHLVTPNVLIAAKNYVAGIYPSKYGGLVPRLYKVYIRDLKEPESYDL